MAKKKILRVVAKTESFRRAGFAFGAAEKDIPLDTLDAKQLAAIKGDRMLVATELEIDASEETAQASSTDTDQAGKPAAEAGRKSTTKAQ